MIGLDFDAERIRGLTESKAPLFEPRLDNMIESGINSGRLKFSVFSERAMTDAEVLWVALDTPVDDADQSDVAFVRSRIEASLLHLPKTALVVISSQMPVGSIRQLEAFAQRTLPNRGLEFACVPENLQLGNAINAFLEPDRIIVGVRDNQSRSSLERLLHTITNRLEWMSIESAEMTKHAINAFLATSVTFANEIASICESVGADAKEVERGLKTERRIGSKAYLAPGMPFSGGTLARDINFLNHKSENLSLDTPLLSAVLMSNNQHKHWAKRKLQQCLGSLSGKTVSVWGLTYKTDTDTLRRSLSVELCDWLLTQGVTVRVFDPVVKHLPERWAGRIAHCAESLHSVSNADALVIGNEHPEFKQLIAELPEESLKSLVIIDASRHVQTHLPFFAHKYVTVGSPLK